MNLEVSKLQLFARAPALRSRLNRIVWVSLWRLVLAYACAIAGALLILVVSFVSLSRPEHLESCQSNTFRTPSESLPVGLQYLNGAVAADQGACSQMGAEQLEAGGNAADAAVTVALCLGVRRPYASGLGGGAFILVHMERNGTQEVIDAREEAPAGASERMYVGRPSAALTGGLAVAVPAELSGLHLLWERHGGMRSWRALVEPVARLAEGFNADAQLVEAINSTAADLRRYPSSAAIYLPGGKVPRLGQQIRNPQLAATLRAVADHGASALYAGALAQAIAADVQAAGGILTVDDLARYRPHVRQPLAIDVQGMTVLGVPPPSSGGATVLQALLYLSLDRWVCFHTAVTERCPHDGCHHIRGHACMSCPVPAPPLDQCLTPVRVRVRNHLAACHSLLPAPRSRRTVLSRHSSKRSLCA